LAFGLLVFLVGRFTTRMEGPVAGIVASAAVFLVPRVFGHAHLAALDMFTALSFTAAAIAVAEADARGARLRAYAIAGAVWGLAMLTRLHGLLLLLPVALWLVWRLRLRAAVPLAVWGISGGVTLFAGWPWLWVDPIRHVRQFLGTATDRIPIHVFYAGQVWADHEVPRHYALAMFLVALPLGLFLLGLLGLWARRHVRGSPAGFYLLSGSLVFMLLVFSWPGVPVYDGERLFLMVFPLWAVAAGVGANWLVEHRVWAARSRRLRLGLVAGFVAIQGVGVVMYHPCYLSHYSLLVGGLPGATRLGFEVNYWGDAVTERLLAEVAEKAPNDVIIYGPNLAPYQAPMVTLSSAALSAQQVAAVGWDPSHPQFTAGCRYGVFYRRRADLDGIPSELLNGRVLGENRILGVWTARVIEFSRPIGEGGLRQAGVRPARGDLATRHPPRPPLRSS
jgi:4-amino-4-deoxy-L-arabinose transferase-like glycosyltransferase